MAQWIKVGSVDKLKKSLYEYYISYSTKGIDLKSREENELWDCYPVLLLKA